MRSLLVLLAVAAPVQADLYRWVDPATGSVNFSNVPPADPALNPQVVPYGAPAAPKAVPAPDPKPAGGTASVRALEAEFNALYAQLAAVPPQNYRNATEPLRRQMQSYEALRSELDRLDPAGAPRRAAASLALAERVRQGFAAGAK